MQAPAALSILLHMAQTRFSSAPDQDKAATFRCCMHEGCGEEGRFKAPAAPGRLGDYLWFCLEHVRAYNASWNYHRGMSEAEIEADRRRAHFWDRPTWRLGSGPAGRIHEAERQAREFSGFGKNGRRHRGNGQEPPRPLNREEDRALRMLGLRSGADFTTIRQRYRELAKELHPDVTGGDRQAEERLKRVTQAYAVLKALHA